MTEGPPSYDAPRKANARVFESGFYSWTCGCGAKGTGYLNRERCEAQALKHAEKEGFFDTSVFYGTRVVSEIARKGGWPHKGPETREVHRRVPSGPKGQEEPSDQKHSPREGAPLGQTKRDARNLPDETSRPEGAVPSRQSDILPSGSGGT